MADMTNPMQSLNPISANNPVTPADSPSSPSDYASVTPHGRGPAPYNIQAAQADLGGVFGAAGVSSGAEHDIYPSGPRQAQATTLLMGAEEQDVYAGTTAGWPASVGPGG
jgi:hypothetical protein